METITLSLTVQQANELRGMILATRDRLSAKVDGTPDMSLTVQGAYFQRDRDLVNLDRVLSDAISAS
jgi:hypothetical protein